ncbi:MAG: hypothetical protein GY795_37565 [Desulfobacterales bacterium]|nr:hypothetical protein [Desulfobacterales bacterium]
MHYSFEQLRRENAFDNIHDGKRILSHDEIDWEKTKKLNDDKLCLKNGAVRRHTGAARLEAGCHIQEQQAPLHVTGRVIIFLRLMKYYEPSSSVALRSASFSRISAA